MGNATAVSYILNRFLDRNGFEKLDVDTRASDS